jgi:[FeFe] hydrogenase H-cluster maturation GTPase HydF
MRKTPSSLRCHIGLLGRRNVGKSSLLNAMVDQTVSIVSPEAGTTTDPVKKPMELLPLGPVMFVDTAGLDDEGELGTLRTNRTNRVLNRLDMALLVTEGARFGPFEESILERLEILQMPTIVVINKADMAASTEALANKLCARGLRAVCTSASTGAGISRLKQAILDNAPRDEVATTPLLSDFVGRGETAVLVAPIDKEAPKGRLITPQVQAIRALLDAGSHCFVVQSGQLQEALSLLNRPPKIVVTDSQAFEAVAAVTPKEVPLTSFSILYSRFKGDLAEQVRGASVLNQLETSDRILIAEACSHHPVEDDIGRVKIPRWLRARTGKDLVFDYVRGREFPNDLKPYRLVIHCGACMWNRREMQNRIQLCLRAGVPITNFGIVIAMVLGILDRALAPFAKTLARHPRTAVTARAAGTGHL